MGFSPKQRIQENNILWAIAFSQEAFVDEQKPTSQEAFVGEQKPTTATKVEQNASKNQDNSISNSYHCFATCGGPRVTIYEYGTRRKGDDRILDSNFHPRQTFTSTHSNEDFYAVTFGQRRSRLGATCSDGKGEEEMPSKQVVCVGGACAQILILDVGTGSLQASLKGSISYISDLKFISCGSGDQESNLLCSATRDQVRIWNLDTLANVCIFAGDPHGHVGDVLSVAWHPTGSRIVSGGGDAPEEDGKHSNIISNGKMFQICIWNVLDSPRLQEAIQASSYLPEFVDDRSQFNPHIERFAVSVHNDVHSNKVDCVAWLGDLVLSKSIFDEIILWQPVIHEESSSISTTSTSKSSIFPIKIFQYGRNDRFYFVRFALSMDFSSSLLAIGNNCGQVYLWDLNDIDNDSHTQILKTTIGKKKSNTNKQNAIIRGLAFSPDGKVLVGCDANGSVFRWDKN